MSVSFQLDERLVGFAAEPAAKGEQAKVLVSEWLTSLEGVHLTWRLEELQGALFAKIPGFPDPRAIDSLLVLIKHDLSATAYINEIQPKASIKANRDLTAGENVFAKDILEILSFDLGVDVPTDSAIVLVRSMGWRKALYYDFSPLGEGAPSRKNDLSAILAKQTLALSQGKFSDQLAHPAMQAALGKLKSLITEQCNDESQYQELIEKNPWFLGGVYVRIERHASLDDKNIPDFTGIRSSDKHRDIIEIKPPFASCFRADGKLAGPFNDAWGQAERYLDFARRQRQYLRDKGLSFEHPRCFLLFGHGLKESQRQELRVKEQFNPAITIITYEELLAIAQAFLDNVIAAGNVTAG